MANIFKRIYDWLSGNDIVERVENEEKEDWVDQLPGNKKETVVVVEPPKKEVSGDKLEEVLEDKEEVSEVIDQAVVKDQDIQSYDKPSWELPKTVEDPVKTIFDKIGLQEDSKKDASATDEIEHGEDQQKEKPIETVLDKFMQKGEEVLDPPKAEPEEELVDKVEGNSSNSQWVDDKTDFVVEPEEEIPTIPAPLQQENVLKPEEVVPPAPEWPEDEEVLTLELKRFSIGQYDTLGKLYLEGKFMCFTLEGSEKAEISSERCIPAGKYKLSLRKEGGKHASYRFRYQEMHQGMLWIIGAHQFPFAQIHEGNRRTDIPGSIILGEQPLREEKLNEKREIWYSEQAYQELYPVLVKKLVLGESIQLEISQV